MRFVSVTLLLTLCLVVGAQFVPEPAGSVACFKTGNEDQKPWDAPECYGNLINPICSVSSDSNTYCHPCTPYRQTDWECDCPPNYYCRPWLGRPDNTYLDGTCVPFDEDTKSCFTAADCDTYQFGLFAPLSTLRLWRFSCVGGFCRPCDPGNATYWGNGTKSCTAWNSNTQTGSSRPGETRTCGADGYIVGGGVLATTLPPPTTAPPPSGITTASTGKAASTGSTTTSDAKVITGAILGLVQVLTLCILFF